MQRIAFDTATATTYVVMADTLSKYTWAESDSTFWKQQEKRWQLGDSIISSTIVQTAGFLAGKF